MNMKTTYTCLNKQIYTDAEFSLIPIRWEDRCKIMQWRNEQIFHLRQNKDIENDLTPYMTVWLKTLTV